MLEPTTQISAAHRSIIAPPAGGNETVKSILWNERELRAGYRLAVYVFLFAIFQQLLSHLSMILRLPQIARGEITPASGMNLEVISLLSAVGAAIILALLEGRRLGVFGLPAATAFRIRFWQGTVWGIAMISAMILVIRTFGGISFDGMALHGYLIFTFAIEWAVVFLAVGLFEEFFFRGYTQYTLTTGVGFWLAATILSALFGAMHLVNGGEGPVGALSVFVIGMFFCLTLRRTGNLWFAVGLHAAFDWGETYLYSVPDSGLSATGHLLNTSFHGPAWLTGGTVGPEGSVAAFAVMGVTAIIFNWAFPAQRTVSESPTIDSSAQVL